MRAPSCGQPVRRHIRSASEGIWVTDTVLARAFERYCASSPAARRYVSFAPGPLESRRRLGRRHMTGLYSFQAHALLQPWALEMPANMGNWQWQAPFRREDPSRMTWEVLPATPPETWTSSITTAPQYAEAPGHVEFGGDGFTPSKTDVPDDMRWLLAQIRSEDFDDLQPSIDIFIKSLKAHASKKNLTPTQLKDVLTVLPPKLVRKYGRMQASSGLVALFDATCGVIDSSKRLSRRRIKPAVWTRFIKQLQLLDGQRSACELLARIIPLVRPDSLGHLSTDVIDVLKSISQRLAQESTQEDGGTPSPSAIPRVGNNPTEPHKHQESWPEPTTHLPFQDHAVSIALSLDRYWAESCTGYMAALPEAVIPSVKPQTQRMLRVFWLSVLARIPSVRQDDLLHWMTKYFGAASEADSLSDTEISQLLALHWTSRGYLSKPDDILSAMSSQTEGPVLVQLVNAIWSETRSDRQAGFAISLCKCLTMLGRLHPFVDSLEALCLESDEVDAVPVELVARACKDYELALRLRRLTDEHPQKFPGSARAWDWRVWDEQMPQLSADHSVGPRELRALLSVDRRWRPNPGQRRRSVQGTLSYGTVAHLERSAWDVVTHFVTDAPPGRRLTRTALHLVTTRVQYMKANGVKPTASILKALTRVVISDLEDGQKGRKTRLKWLVELIAATQGSQAAEEAARMLSRWSRLNAQLIKARAEAGRAEGLDEGDLEFGAGADEDPLGLECAEDMGYSDRRDAE